MTKHFLINQGKTWAFIFFVSAMIGCNYSSKTEAKESSSTTSKKEVISDSIVKFLLTSASSDFRNHQPPTPIDFRNIKIGYLVAPNMEKTYILCGEFLSKENQQWQYFTTLKTSGYEQYIGDTKYCLDATFILTDENSSRNLRMEFLSK